MQETSTKRRYRLAGTVAGDFPLLVMDTPLTQDHVLHSHDFVEIALVESGKAVHTTSRGRRIISSGDVLVIPEGVRHGYEEVKNLGVKNVIFAFSLLEFVHSDLRHIPGFHSLFQRRRHSAHEFSALAPDEMGYTGRLAKRMQDELDAKRPGYKTACLAALFELVLFLSRKEFKKGSGIEHGLDRVLGHMEQCHVQKLTVGGLAKLVGCSARNFQRLFRGVTGKSPVAYLMDIRLRHAKKLLADATLSVSQVAELAGFGDSAYFAKQFKRALAITPSEYRKLVST